MPDSLFGSAGLDLTRRPESSPTPQGSGQSSYPRGTLGQAPRPTPTALTDFTGTLQ